MKLTYWKKIRIYLKELWRKCEDGCKSVFRYAEDISCFRNKNILRFRLNMSIQI